MKFIICYACTNIRAPGRKAVGPSLTRFTFQSWKDDCIRESTMPLWSSWGNPARYKCLERLVLAKIWDFAKSTRTVMSHMQHIWTNMAWHLLWKPTHVTVRLIAYLTIASTVMHRMKLTWAKIFASCCIYLHFLKKLMLSFSTKLLSINNTSSSVSYGVIKFLK